MPEQTINDKTPLPATSGKRRRLIGDRGEHFLRRIEGETGANIGACYQCERCTNACPVAYYMDIKPHQVIRYIQLGWRENLMRATTIWVCLSCEMCTTYCPNEVGVAETINHLRTMAFDASVEPAEKTLAIFHEKFIKQLGRFGRVNEFWLMGSLNRHPHVLKEKIATGSLKEEMLLGLELLRKGKLKFFPHRCKAAGQIRRICEKRRGGVIR